MAAGPLGIGTALGTIRTRACAIAPGAIPSARGARLRRRSFVGEADLLAVGEL